jgi:hypothetical protein
METYLAARLANHSGAIAGLRSVGIVSAVLSTLGLSLLRKWGRVAAGATFVATPAGLSILNSGD